ncbi:hypothetical protein [Streptomyces sp. NPDC001787]|uniref:hypothetical protein n=1 Tax=Streptomyces sp. NPDC001787 TaxID=3154523 RepID=UPI00331D67D8
MAFMWWLLVWDECSGCVVQVVIDDLDVVAEVASRLPDGREVVVVWDFRQLLVPRFPQG